MFVAAGLYGIYPAGSFVYRVAFTGKKYDMWLKQFNFIVSPKDMGIVHIKYIFAGWLLDNNDI